MGTLSFMTAESGRRYGAEDLILATEIGRRASLAIENARAYTEARERRPAPATTSWPSLRTSCARRCRPAVPDARRMTLAWGSVRLMVPLNVGEESIGALAFSRRGVWPAVPR